MLISTIEFRFWLLSGAYCSCGHNVGIWIQRLTVRTPTTVCCVLEHCTLSALLQSTQLWNEYQVETPSWRLFSAMSFSDECTYKWSLFFLDGDYDFFASSSMECFSLLLMLPIWVGMLLIKKLLHFFWMCRQKSQHVHYSKMGVSNCLIVVSSMACLLSWSTSKHELGRNHTWLPTPSRRRIDLYKHWLNVYDWGIIIDAIFLYN